MIPSISGSTAGAALPYGAGKPSPVALQAQLQRFQQQLSDCVNCASAATPKGKADIEAIAARIAQVQQRIAQTGGADQAGAAPVARAAPAGRIDVFA